MENIKMEKLNKAIENYKVNQLSGYYEINSVSEYMEHICAYRSDNSKTWNFEQCLKEHINELEECLKSDTVAYVCSGNNDIYPLARVVEIWEEDQEFEQTCEIVKYNDLKDLFDYLKYNALMCYYEDYLFMEKIKKEIGSDNQPFAYDWENQELIKGE